MNLEGSGQKCEVAPESIMAVLRPSGESRSLAILAMSNDAKA